MQPEFLKALRSVNNNACCICGKEGKSIPVSSVQTTGLINHAYHCFARSCFERARALVCDTPNKFLMVQRCCACGMSAFGVREHLDKFPRCGGCNVAAYCSQQCQKKDWKEEEHKKWCITK